MPKNNTSKTESLIAEPLCVRLSIDWTPAEAITSGEAKAAARALIVAGENVPATPSNTIFLAPEAQRIVDALKAICEAHDAIVVWGGRAHRFVPQHFANAPKGTQLIGRPGAERAAQIVIAPLDQPAQHIFTKFAVVPNGC